MVPGVADGAVDAGVEPATAHVRTLTDAILAARVAQGNDGAAEAELCRRFAPRIRLYGLKHLRDEERARDLVQSVLLAVLQRLRSGPLDEPEHLDRFVLGTCRNLALQVRRTDGRAEPTAPEVLHLIPAPAAADRADLPRVRRCMQRLDLRARTVLYLSFGREKSAEDIARALETTAGNVRVLRHRAVAQLRACVDAAAPEVTS